MDEQLTSDEINYLLKLVNDEQQFRAEHITVNSKEDIVKMATDALAGSSDVLPTSIRKNPKLMKMYHQVKLLKEFIPKEIFAAAVESAVSHIDFKEPEKSAMLISMHDKLHLMKSL